MSERPTTTQEKRVVAGGFVQYREVRTDVSGPTPGQDWKFIVSSFDDSSSGQNWFCTVQLADGSLRRNVPIDAENRITINGRKYGRKNWDH